MDRHGDPGVGRAARPPDHDARVVAARCHPKPGELARFVHERARVGHHTVLPEPAAVAADSGLGTVKNGATDNLFAVVDPSAFDAILDLGHAEVGVMPVPLRIGFPKNRVKWALAGPELLILICLSRARPYCALCG